MTTFDDRIAPPASRRAFLRDLAALGVGAGALSAWARTAGALAPTKPSVDRIGLQLYTVADQLRLDFDGTLEKVAQTGYKLVEFAGYGGKTPEAVRATLDRLKLRAPSTHIAMETLRRDLDAQIHVAQVIGHQYLTIPSLGRTETPMNTADAWKRVAEECNAMGAKAKAAGVRMAFHSHYGEFVDLGGGKTGMDVFVSETDPAVFDFQMDLGWAHVAGQDPVAWFQRYPGRFTMWHVKDVQGKQPVPVGAGVIDFRPIFAAWRTSGVEYFFVEQDGAAQWPGGSLASVATSYQALRKLLA